MSCHQKASHMSRVPSNVNPSTNNINLPSASHKLTHFLEFSTAQINHESWSCSFHLMSPQPLSKSLQQQSAGHLTDLEISRILTFMHVGQSSREIVVKVGRSQSTVSRVIRTYDYESFISRSRTCVWKWKMRKHEDRILTRYAKKNDDLAFHDLLNLGDVKVSASTLQRQLKEINLFFRIRRKKPFLTTKHKRDRLAWAWKYRDWTVEDWKRVI